MTAPTWEAREHFNRTVANAEQITAETPLLAEAYCAMIDQGLEPAKVDYDLRRRLRNLEPVLALFWAKR